jgi:excinuclease ABC subunit C
VVTRPPSGSIPDGPGSYQFVDADGRVLYVGKAKSLRQRLNSYFQDPIGLPPRTAQMVSQADHVEWMVVDTEAEALLLEHNLIKEFQPRYNVRLKDDKSYPWLAVTVSDEWPRPAVVRGRKRTGVRYFGPYPNAGAIRDTLDLLLRSFPVRTCSDNKFRRHQRLGKPCLLYHIERCAGPCVGLIEHQEYDQLVTDLMSFLTGDTAPLEKGLEAAMREAATSLEFERASVLRDKLEAVRTADAVRQMELSRPEDLDVLGLAEDELEPGQGGGPAGPLRGQGGGPHAGPADRAHPGRRVRRLRLGGAQAGPGADHARGHRGRVAVPDGPPGRAGVGAGAHAGLQARPARDGRAQRP